MKKTGFTLAEVLITLAIIGVVATMTLPALMTNTQEQQAKTGLKKMINTLTLAGEMAQSGKNFNYNLITSGTFADDESQSIMTILRNGTNIDYTRLNTSFKTKGGAAETACSNTANTGNYNVFFKDGTMISYPLTAKITADQAGTGNYKIQNDGDIHGIPVLVDINGTKGPNVLSNCDSKATEADSDLTNDVAASSTACQSKTARVIRDQFGVRLRGSQAVPNGPAARWAYNN